MKRGACPSPVTVGQGKFGLDTGARGEIRAESRISQTGGVQPKVGEA